MLVNFIEENPLVSTSFVACSCSLISFDDVPDSLMPTSSFWLMFCIPSMIDFKVVEISVRMSIELLFSVSSASLSSLCLLPGRCVIFVRQ